MGKPNEVSKAGEEGLGQLWGEHHPPREIKGNGAYLRSARRQGWATPKVFEGRGKLVKNDRGENQRGKK